MKYSFILNPKAGKGKGQRILERLKSEIADHRLDAELLISEKPGHATQLAARCRGEIVVAVGGDGTVNEVANGLIGSSKVLGILPSGSGNDMIKSIGIPVDSSGAFAKILAFRTSEIDCSTVQCFPDERESATPKRYFLNGVGIGFDAAVAERTTKAKYLHGTALYVLSVFQTLGKYASPTFKITLDSESRISKNLLIAIGNGRCAGGGFYLTPDAKVNDGYLDVCLIDEISIPKILAIMPKVMKGKHQSEKEVTMMRTKQIFVEAAEPFHVHADGEIVGRNVTGVKIEIVPTRLRVIIG